MVSKLLMALVVWTVINAITPSWANQDTVEFGGPDQLVIVTANGRFEFSVEIADTPERRSRGLMFREKMPVNSGMLFKFGRVEPIAMWMRNTPLSLDMIFINPDGTIHRIEHGTTPFSEQIISSGGPVSHVLEVNAGISKLLGIRAGDKIQHRSSAASQ